MTTHKSDGRIAWGWHGVMATMLLAIVLTPIISKAETVVRTGESVSVSANQVVENDFYGYGGTITHSGEIKEDAYAVAGSVTVNGQVGVDLTAVAGSVQVHAPVGDDVRLVAGETVIASEVNGDLFVMGGLLKVLSSAKVNGNIYFYGGEADIEGEVTGSVMGWAEKFTVNSRVGGGINTTGALTLGDNAVIGGDVIYKSNSELDRAQGASVSGNVSRSDVSDNGVGQDNRNEAPIFMLVIWSFTALCVYLFFRNNIDGFVRGSKPDLVKSGLIGLLAVLLLPVLSIILMVTVLGIWFGLLLLLSWLLLLLISLLMLPIFAGHYLFTIFKANRRLDWLTVIVGVLALALLMYLPFLGGAIIFLATLIVAGYLALSFYRQIKDLM